MASESDKSADAVLSVSNVETVEAESSDHAHLAAKDPEGSSSSHDVTEEQEICDESMEQVADDLEESSSSHNVTKERESGDESMEQGVEDPGESPSSCDVTEVQGTDGESKEQEICNETKEREIADESKEPKSPSSPDNSNELEASISREDTEVQAEESVPKEDSKSVNVLKSNQKHQVIYKKVGEKITVEITEPAKKRVTSKGLERIDIPTDGSEETTTSSSVESKGKACDQGSDDSTKTDEVGDGNQGQKLPGEHDIFVCKVCRKYFVFSAFRKHVEVHTKMETEVCCACGYFNKDGGKVNAHANCNVCWECRMIFKSSQSLKDHLKLHKQQKGQELSGDSVQEKETKITEHDYSKTFGDEQMEIELDEMEAEPTLSGNAQKRYDDVVMCFEEMEEDEDVSKEPEVPRLSAPPLNAGQRLPEDDDVIECRLCNKYFVYSALKKHVKQEHTRVRTGVCSACGYFDVRGGKLKDHPDCFVCWGCSVSFKTSGTLKTHLEWHYRLGKEVISRKEAAKRKKAGEKNKPSTAAISPVIVGKGKKVSKEMRNKTEKRPLETTKTLDKAPVKLLDSKQKSNSMEQVLECRLCNDFFLYSSLKEHVKQHTKKETEVCSKCGYYEKTGGAMREHPSCFACWTCNIFFNSAIKLKEHMQLHDIPDENDEWHMCLICMARFCHANGLKEHMRWHEGEHDKEEAEMRKKERKARIKQWGKDEDNGKREIKIKALVTKDEEDTMKLCVRCNMFFASVRSLKRHVKNAHTHTDTELCEKCGFFEKAGGPVGLHDCVREMNKLKRKAAEKQTRDHEGRYKCDLCARTYAFSQGLRAHMATHVPKEDRPYCCNHCPKKFAKKILLQDHLRVHTGEKPYLCHMCAKTFRSGANLRQHSRRCKGAVSKHPSPSKPPPQPQTMMSQPSLYGYPNPQVRFYSKPVPPDKFQPLIPGPNEPPVGEQSVVYEVQMQVNEEGESTVVINLDDIGEIKTYTQNADNRQLQNNTDMEEVVQVDFEPQRKTQQTSENQVIPVKIHASPFKPSDATEGEEVLSGQVEAVGETGHEETVSPSQGGNKSEDVQDDLYDVINDIEINTDEDNDEDWVDGEGPTGDSEMAADGGDHDYINVKEKPSSSVLEEKQNQDIRKPRLLEIMNMCPLCKGLFETKLDIKEHIKSIHKKETRYDGIVVLALPRGNSSIADDSGSDSDSEDESDENQDTLPLKWSYSCSHCHELFDKKEIDDHLKSVELKKGQCATCFRTHKGHSKVKKHEVRCRLSRARKVYQCPYCTDIKRVTLAELKGHLKNRHELTEYACTLCDKSFKSKRSMAVHMKVHVYKEPKPKKRYICELCDRELNDRIALRIHKMQHKDPKPFKCKLCPKAYSFPNGLKIHMRGHNNEFPYMCEFCSRTFKTKHCLMCHIRTHTGIKPFVCEGCGKKFRTKGNLRQHTQRCMSVARKEELIQFEQIHPIAISQGQEQIDMTPVHQEQIEITTADLEATTLEEIKIQLLQGVHVN